MVTLGFLEPLILIGLSVLILSLIRLCSNEDGVQNRNHKEDTMQEEIPSHPAGIGEMSNQEEFFRMIDDSLSLHKDIYGITPWVEDDFK